MTHQAQVRPAVEADAEQRCGIYNHYVMNSSITFEERPITLRWRIASAIFQSASLPCLYQQLMTT